MINSPPGSDKTPNSFTPHLRGKYFAIIFSSVIITDRLTKLAARTYLTPYERISFLGDTIRLEYSLNSGAFLSLGSNLPPQYKFMIMIVLSSVLLLSLAFILIRNQTLSKLEFITLSFILSGGIGNLIDRITNNGLVEDFLNLGIDGLRTGIFNVADMAITGGLIISFYCLWYLRSSKTS